MNEKTLQKMNNLKFYGMLRAFRTTIEAGQMSRYTSDEMVAFLIESEWDDRQNRKIERGLKNAKFRYAASIESIIYNEKRNLDKNEVHRLADCTFIEKRQNVIITGSTGAGKSYLSSALGHQACMNGYKVIYTNAGKLMGKLKMAKADGSYMRELSRIEKQGLLILDDFGMQPLDQQGRASLMEIIEDRHGKSSLIITSQLPIIGVIFTFSISEKIYLFPQMGNIRATNACIYWASGKRYRNIIFYDYNKPYFSIYMKIVECY